MEGPRNRVHSPAVDTPWRWVVILAAFLSWSAVLGSARAAAAETRIQGEERARVLDRLRERLRDVTTVRATVVQRKRHPLLKAEAVSQGTLLFKRPDRLRWEVDTPERTVIVMDGHTLLTYRPDRHEAERRDLRGDIAARAAVEFLGSGITLDVVALEKRFELDLYRENGRLLLRLAPRARWLAQAVASVAIAQEEGDVLPRQILVVGRKGDRTETTLTQVLVNPDVTEDAFTLRLGPGVRVTDLRTPAGESGSGR